MIEASETVARGARIRTDRSHDGDRSGRARAVIAALVAGLLAAGLVGLTSGASDASVARLIADMWSAAPLDEMVHQRDRLIIMDIRLPRVILGMLVGAALAVAGAAMQGLFRNPLADPGLVGVSSGAGLGAVSVIVLGQGALAPLTALLGILALPAAAFAGALATTWMLYRVATRRGRTSVATMLLAGLAFSALAMAMTGMLIFIADDGQLRDFTFWQLGSLAGATWQKIAVAGPVIGLSLAATGIIARGLNRLALGEAAAIHLGTNVQRLKRISIAAVSASVGTAVAASGGIGFVGIIVPHLLRLAIGPDNRYLLPASALLGAGLLVVADAFARTLAEPAELPIGIVTAIAGAPVFLWILLRQRSVVDL